MQDPSPFYSSIALSGEVGTGSREDASRDDVSDRASSAYSFTAPVMMVGFSHYDAAFAAISHILEQGRRRIGFLGARMDPRVQRRFEGYRDAMPS